MSVDTLRETFHINRIPAEKLEDFLTAQTYRPEITNAKAKIHSLSWSPLQSLCATPIRQGKSPTYSEGFGLRCIKPRQTRETLVSLEGCEFIDNSTAAEIANQKLQHGDVVITRSGAGTIGRASIFLSDEVAYTNDHLFIVRTSKLDACYLVSLLKSYWGERLLESGISGSTGQLNLSNEHIKALPIYTPNHFIQKYIGDKVRQAERLRTWGKLLEIKINGQFESLSENPPRSQTTWRVSPDVLEPYRINPSQYNPVVLELLNRAKIKGIILQPLSDLMGVRGLAGGATPKGASYIDSGVLFARVQNVKPLSLDLGDAVFIDAATDAELARSRCKENDVILTITGYPGTASLVIEEDLPVNINQHSVRFDVKHGVGAGYICAALNSRFLKYQIDRSSIGGTRDALDYPSVKNLLIPRFDSHVEEDINEAVLNVIAGRKLSKKLTTAAKLLVEGLIEGLVTEAELIAAQQGLEVGDTEADAAILRRLKTDGLDGKGQPLFGDVERVYELLKDADQYSFQH